MTAFPEYPEYDGLGLARLIAGGEIGAREVLEAAIERIETHNPRFNAVVQRFYDDAEAALAAGLPDGPLAGVPFLLKDLALFYAGRPLSNGSRLFADFVPGHDATLVRRYRAAGLLMLGKTNTPEFGITMATEPVLHGPTRNPWHPDYSAGGSSGGAAAAVAAGMVPLAHASDGGGSIRMPASNCGLFGLKLSRARVPIGPDVGEGWSGLAGNHCVSRSVRDSAALLELSHGPETGDPYAAPPPARPFLDEVGAPPGRLRIAMSTRAPGGFPVHPDCVRAVERTAALCEELGHSVEPEEFTFDAGHVIDAMWVIVVANLRNLLELRWRMLGRQPGPEGLESMSWLAAQDSRRFACTDYAHALQTLHALGRRLGRFLEERDVLLTPVMAQPPLPLGEVPMTGDDLEQFRIGMAARMPFTPLWNMTGCPAMSVPLYWTAEGLPVGVQFGARFGDEATLLRLASQLEQARPWADRRPVL